MDNSLFSFFSDTDIENVAYLKRGSSTSNIVYIIPDVDIYLCDWRVYASDDGGISWISDSSPRYNTSSPFEYDLQVGVSGYTASTNQLAVTFSGSATTKQYILIGLWV